MPVIQKSKEIVELDGTTLEGGGQLLRVALCLSSLTGIPIHVSRIRGKRGAVSSTGIGKDGGLKPAHLAAVKWLAKATSAITEGMEVRSTDLLFQPAIRDDGSHRASLWGDIYDNGSLIRRESRIPMSTAGSIPLILQAILPYVLYIPSPVPLWVTIEGGTNVSKSPSIDYVSQVLLPLLSTKLGIEPIGVEIHKRGWSAGQSEVGCVTFKITPRNRGSTQPSFHFTKRGDLERVHISVIAPDDGSRQRIRSEALKQLGKAMPRVELQVTTNEDSRHHQHIYLLLVAETSSGFRLGRDCLSGRKVRKGFKKKSGCAVEEEDMKMVSSVIKELQRELLCEGCVDEYMEDQLVIFQALAQGASEVDAGTGRQASLHTQTAQWVAGKILEIDFQGDKGHGTNLRAGQTPEERTEMVQSSVVHNVEQLHI